MTAIAKSPARYVPVLLVLLASAAVIGATLLFQYVGGYAPCELCLYERWPYYAVITLAIIGLFAGGGAATRWVIALCAVIFAAGSVLAFYHVGVEQHWFPGPTACTGSSTGAQTIDALRAQLLARQPVDCDQPAWQLFGISLAGWNLVASLLLAVFCAIVSWRRGRQ
jgi:disulfide bond formation protein DsbB